MGPPTTRANAGGPPWLPMQTLQAARIAQFHRCVNTARPYLWLGIVLLVAGTAFGRQYQDEALSERAQKIADKKRKEILVEASRLRDHVWAGSYYEGDGLGANISVAIAPHSGYVFEWHGCLGLYGLNYGAVTWTNGRIELSFTYQNQRGFGGIAPEFIPVSWRSRHYLVPANDIVGFCNDVNQGREPRADVHGSYLLRRGDENKDAMGFPEVPGRYRSYLLANPIEAAIIAVSPYATRPSVTTWKFKDTPVTLNAGTNTGLLVGMELVVTQPRNVVQSVRLTRVAADQSQGIMVQAGEGEPGPKVGWRLSTRAPWYDVIRKPNTNGLSQ
jgi:hypothetical protein